jgi:hypothetical protein
MAVISFSREASKEEMGREIDRRGAVIDALTEERDRLKEIVDGTGLATAAIAAERDRLALANAELLAGLKPFGEAAEDVDDDDKDHWGIWEHPATIGLTIGDLRKASALLDKHKATSTEREGE